MMVQVEQVARNTPDNFYLNQDLACMFFFFHLLLYKPLKHLEGCAVLFLDCKVDKPVDHGSDFLLMGVHFVKYFAG